MRTLAEILNVQKPSETIETPDVDNLQVSKSRDIKKFIEKHKIKKTGDANGNDDKVFKATDEKFFDRPSNNYGYNPGQDAAVTENVDVTMHPESVDERTAVERAAKTSLHHAGDENHVGYTNHPAEDIAKGLQSNGYDHDYTDNSGTMFTKWTNHVFHEVKIKPIGSTSSHVEVSQNPSRYSKEEVEATEGLCEHLASDASARDYIEDFVNSSNPKFDGKSKKERVRMALGAFYGKKKISEGLHIDKSSPNAVKPGKSGAQIRKFVAYNKNGGSKTVFASDENQAKHIAGDGIAKIQAMRESKGDFIISAYQDLNESNREVYLKNLQDEKTREKTIKFARDIYEENDLKSVFHNQYDAYKEVHLGIQETPEDAHKNAVSDAEQFISDYYGVSPDQYRKAA